MRIISGKYKNRSLKSPNSDSTHPMGERERIALFNMLGDITGKTVLDLFAGTGALGLEALSRGAVSATFIDNNNKALTCLKQNVTDIANTKVIKANVYNIDLHEKYDVIFIDPPYDQFDDRILRFKNILTEEGIMVVSSPRPINDSSRKYANCYISLLK